MELKRKVLKDGLSVGLTLFNCTMISLFLILEKLELTFIVGVMVIISLLRLKSYIKSMKKMPKLISFDRHVLIVQSKEIMISEIKSVSLYIRSRKTYNLVIKTHDDEIRVDKRYYKDLYQLCDELENLALDRFEFDLFTYKEFSYGNIEPYTEQMTWQDYMVKKFKFKQTKGIWILFVIGLMYAVMGVVSNEVFTLTALKTAASWFALYTVYLITVVVYGFRGYSGSESCLKSIKLFFRLPLTLICFVVMIYYMFSS